MAEMREELQEFIRNIQQQIKKTIADGEALVQEAELRIAETDRLLESQGLTREQVLDMKFTDEQIAAANAELERRGLEKLNLDDYPSDFADPAVESENVGHNIAERASKLRRLMRPIRI